MGLIRDILGMGKVVSGVAEVFIPNKTQAQTQAHLRAMGAQAQYSSEFLHMRTGFFDRMVDGLNRLPRPVMALGTVGLFSYAMIDPNGFAMRMQGLDYVPDPLWWLLGAIVSFYFGAREMHHFRQKRSTHRGEPLTQQLGFMPVQTPVDGNAALDDWRLSQIDGDETSTPVETR